MNAMTSTPWVTKNNSEDDQDSEHELNEDEKDETVDLAALSAMRGRGGQRNHCSCGPEGPAAGGKRPHMAEAQQVERSETVRPEATD